MNVVSIYMKYPHELHWKASKIILQYVQGTRHIGIPYVVYFDLDLVGFTDSDWEGYRIDQKSTSIYVLMFGSEPIFWSNKK